MVNLTFGEQVKIILSRRGMTIKQLAEMVEEYTGKPMSRQNMTQRLGRDNFQEQDMRMIAEILGCKFTLSIMEIEETALEEKLHSMEREVTIGELAEMVDEVVQVEAATPETDLSNTQESGAQEDDAQELGTGEIDVNEADAQKIGDTTVEKTTDEKTLLRKGIGGYFRKITPNKSEEEQSSVVGEINPYTGKEYKTNSVRMHPKRIGYVQVYDQEQHKWTDMTEWAFLGYQERKKALLGKEYEPPIYLD